MLSKHKVIIQNNANEPPVILAVVETVKCLGTVKKPSVSLVSGHFTKVFVY